MYCTLKFSRIVEVLHGPRTVPLLAQVGVGSHLVEDGVFVDPKPHVFDDLFVERLVVLRSWRRQQECQDLCNSSVAVMLREMQREVNKDRPFESRLHV